MYIKTYIRVDITWPPKIIKIQNISTVNCVIIICAEVNQK